MDSKLLATKTHTILKEMGIEIKLGQVYEMYAKVSGYKSWNVAKSKDSLERVIKEITLDPFEMDLAHNALEKLVDLDKNGLPSPYISFDDFLTDWYPDLPWNDEDFNNSAAFLLKNDLFIQTAKSLEKKFGVDLANELRHSIINRKNEEYQGLAISILTDLENALKTMKASDMSNYMIVWYDKISLDWENESDKTTAICGFIKLDDRFDEIRSKLKDLCGTDHLTHFDSIHTDM